MGRYKVV